MRRLVAILFLCFPVLAGAADATLHRLLLQERYAEARQRGVARLDEVQGDTPAAQRQRLDALNDLLDSAIAERDVTTPEATAWAERAIAIGTALGEDAAPQLTKAYAVQAVRARRDPATMKVALEKARSFVADERVPRADRAYVRQVEGMLAGDAAHFDVATDAFARARATLAQPRDDWQRLRLAVQELLYGAYAERASRADALAVAEHGAAQLRELCGANSLTHAFALTTLGQLRYFRGDYLGAARDAGAALQVLQAWPERKMDRGRALNVLANARRILGDYDGAGGAYRDAIVLAEAAHDETLPGRLDGLAQLERKLGHDDAARALLERALALIADPAKDRRALSVQGNLGDLSLDQNDLDAAQSHYDAALAIARQVYGPQHEARLRPQQGAALVALRRGRAGDAAQQLREVARAEQDAYGNDYPPLQFTRCALALALARSGDDAGAWDLAVAAERQRIALLRHVVPLLGATQALGFKRSLQPCGGLVLALAQRAPDASRDARATQAWSVIAAARGVATQLQAQRLAALREAGDADGRARWQHWQGAAQAYADALLFNGDAKALARAQQALAAAEAQLGEALRERAGLGEEAFDLAAMLATLPREQPLVAFIDSDAFDLAAAADELWPSQRRFHAFVRHDGATRLHDLGAAAAREAEVARWQRALRVPAGDVAELRAAGEAVKASIWAPLQLPQRGKVLWIADGALFRVNPLALPDGDGWLVERGLDVAMLDTERDLALGMPATAAMQRLLLIGAPDYGAAPASCAQGLAPLPGAAKELRAVAQQWGEGKTRTLSGDAVRKDTLRRELDGIDALHLATHLVSLGETCPAPASERASARGARVTRDEPANAPAAGDTLALALAGANRWYERRDAAVLLSVPEILALPLQRLRFVVLAACDSGSGPVLAEEGVFGLRRAFRLAGARAVVMSLWPVDDAASVAWMTSFYAALANGDVLASAVSGATRASLAARREHGESTHPYYWAAYVASGRTP